MANENEFLAYAVKEKSGRAMLWSYKPRPLGNEDVEIRITHCGICGSDLHTISSGWGPTRYPVVVGHEIVGVVVSKGSQVSQLKVGDRVGVGPQVWACMNSCTNCKAGDDNHCSRSVYTYNGVYPDGQPSYGGYAQAIRVSSHFAIKIPDAIPSDLAAPLLCAGVTVWTPIVEHNIKFGTKVVVTGLGGLGHLAVQFASKMGAEVTVLSHSTNKSEDAKALGAKSFIDSNNAKAVAAARSNYDVILVTAVFKGMNWDLYLSLLKLRGKVIILCAPEEKMIINPMSLLIKKASILGSSIGSTAQMKDMLEFASKHNVRPVIEKLPMNRVNDGIELVSSGRIRYRCVLENQPGDYPIKSSL